MPRKPKGSSTAANEAFVKKQFAWAQTEPIAWAGYADSMMRSFEIIAAQAESDELADAQQWDSYSRWKQANDGSPQPPLKGIISVVPNAMMLAGMAVELLLKGIAVQNPAIVASIGAGTTAIPGDLWTHRLRGIAALAGVTLDANEDDLCKGLEVFLVWAGRYPVPKNHEAMMPGTAPGGGQASLSIRYGSDYSTIRALTTRLRALLPSADYDHVIVM
ncbi:hypothetical protein [Burkholderia mayonis]|nr:hypothetical protein [Burkholderia mayonis]